MKRWWFQPRDATGFTGFPSGSLWPEGAFLSWWGGPRVLFNVCQVLCGGLGGTLSRRAGLGTWDRTLHEERAHPEPQRPGWTPEVPTPRCPASRCGGGRPVLAGGWALGSLPSQETGRLRVWKDSGDTANAASSGRCCRGWQPLLLGACSVQTWGQPHSLLLGAPTDRSLGRPADAGGEAAGRTQEEQVCRALLECQCSVYCGGSGWGRAVLCSG